MFLFEIASTDEPQPAIPALDYVLLGELTGNFLARMVPDRYNKRDDFRVALSFVDDVEIGALNASYRQIDEPTDVLSFPLWEEGGVFSPPTGWDVLPLGDVVVSPAFVEREARAKGSDYSADLALVIVHGALHLVGYDHDTDERQTEMWSAQEHIAEEYAKLMKSQDANGGGPRESEED